jgi:hypothetical protein
MGSRPDEGSDLRQDEHAQWTAQEKSFRLAQQLVHEGGSQELPRTRVVSLRRATAGDLVLPRDGDAPPGRAAPGHRPWRAQGWAAVVDRASTTGCLPGRHGYGLRAWRALTALTILLVGCEALFIPPRESLRRRH